MQGKLTVYTEKSAAVLVNCRTFVILFLKETGLVGQARLADIPALGGVFLRQRVGNGHLRMMFRTVASRAVPSR